MLFIFLTVYFSLYLGMNYYPLWRLTSLLGIARKWPFYVLLVLLTVSYISAHHLEATWGNGFTRAIYLAAASWKGIVMLLFFSFAALDLLRLPIKIPAKPAAIAVIIFVASLTIYAMINARQLVVREVAVTGPVDLKIAQLSDIHIGSISPDAFKKIIERTNRLGADLILITGDLVDNLNERNRAALEMIDQLDGPVYFTTGNHEGYAGVDRVIDILNKTHVTVLRNEVVDLGEIQLIGLDDSFRFQYISEQLEALDYDETKYTILMYHRPDDVAGAARNGIDLMLAGHTHNGQIFPFNFMVRLTHKYIKGIHQIEGMTLNVCVGTGLWGPPMRLGSRCEIVLINMQAE
ncbi:MAG: metallophosphoesterase [Phycisphaerae bacterium]|nr:metallophosphoesterase [Phycisphaerae bacterium]